jgi:hypothetical protein
MEKAGNKIYSASATLIRIIVWFFTITITITSAIIISLGVSIIKHKNHLIKVEGVVVNSSKNCTTPNTDKSIKKLCSFDVSYPKDGKINGKTYKKTIITDKIFDKDDTVTLWYNDHNPQESEFNPFPRAAGWSLICSGVLTLLIIWSLLWIITR